MSVKTLVTYSFDKNVATWDRAFRVVSGLAVGIVAVVMPVPTLVSVGLVGFGFAWLMTGVVSRCGMYYLLGYSTCPLPQTPTQ